MQVQPLRLQRLPVEAIADNGAAQALSRMHPQLMGPAGVGIAGEIL
jgi:hypothetical protein